MYQMMIFREPSRFSEVLEDNGYDPDTHGGSHRRYLAELYCRERNHSLVGRSCQEYRTYRISPLKNGIKAPKSGSVELNGRSMAEQIGSEIFIDTWALANPGQS